MSPNHTLKHVSLLFTLTLSYVQCVDVEGWSQVFKLIHLYYLCSLHLHHSSSLPLIREYEHVFFFASIDFQSTSYLLSLKITMSKHHSPRILPPDLICQPAHHQTNKMALSADPWCKPLSNLIPSVTHTAYVIIVLPSSIKATAITANPESMILVLFTWVESPGWWGSV